MDETFSNNYAELSGFISQPPSLSHENRGEQFYKLPLAVQRLSGTYDTVNVILRSKQFLNLSLSAGDRLHVFGQLRSFNNKGTEGAKLVISVFARELIKDNCEDRNDILLRGTICKLPTLRKTPLGREISDFMLAINRRYGRSDYIPCIAWGQKAHEISRMSVGTVLTVSGRFQSREYIKSIEDRQLRKTAYEVSVIDFE